ncbi:Type 2A phosphatase-associated protein 42 [Naganishia albida]|nr:Type 2A phosphatase-associated protein 42 [Naganishia albida]
MSSTTSLTLPALLTRTLQSLLPIFTDQISTSLPSAQQTLHAALADLALARRMIDTLGIFSTNESMEDVADGEMVYMAVDWVVAEVQGRANGDGLRGRIAVLERSQEAYEAFLWLLETYEFPLQDGQTYSPGASSIPQDPAGRRDAKIKQFRMEKALKERVTAATGVDVSSTALPAIIALINNDIPTITDVVEGTSRINISTPSTSVNPSDSTTRGGTIALLSLLLTQSHAALASIHQELELLRSAAMSAHIEAEDHERAERERKVAQRRQEGERGLKEDEMWRLDTPLRFGSNRGKVGELIDDRGKPTQPFTILPSTGLQNLSDRARLQSEVFRSSHRLPTMTIDEYLEEERQRGNIITGGGPESENQLTESEQLAIDAEDDGTVRGERKAEQKRLKDEKWARYTDTHRKGEGNTLNRG